MIIRVLRNSKTLFVVAIIILLSIGTVLATNTDGLMYEEFSFTHEGNTLKGVLVSPKNPGPSTPCVIFVHGSGKTPRDAYGYYQSYWERFANKGWCSMSWDKPGVGRSEGNWKHQSMDDRALEVSAAINFLRSRPGMAKTPIGLIGFSQAGWVMPKVAGKRNDLAFIISVSGAIDWMEQSRYSGEIRLKSEGFSTQKIAKINAFGNRVDAAIKSNAPYQTYLKLMENAPDGESAQMSAGFWKFVQRNWQSNVRQDLRNVNVPFLAIFGGNDAYVDPTISARVYSQELELSPAPFFEVLTFKNGDHNLMASDEIKPIKQGLGAWFFLFKIWIGGEHIFPDGYLTTLENWLARFDNVK